MLSNELLSPTQNANTEQQLYNEVFYFLIFFWGGGCEPRHDVHALQPPLAVDTLGALPTPFGRCRDTTHISHIEANQ